MSPSRTPRSTGANMRVAAAVLSLLAIALLALDPDAASAGRYEVVQCDRANRAFTDADFDRVNGGDYGFLYRCEEDEDANSLQIRSITGAPQGRSGRISWTAPAETRIVGVDLEARMRNDAGHQARLSFFDAAGNESGRIATGTDSAGTFEPYGRNLEDGGRQSFGASLTCVERDGCQASDQARNWIRSIDLTLEDRTPPKIVAGGSLIAGGWKRAGGGLSAVATDAGSGVRSFDIRVNGTAVPPSQTLPCALIADAAGDAAAALPRGVHRAVAGRHPFGALRRRSQRGADLRLRLRLRSGSGMRGANGHGRQHSSRAGLRERRGSGGSGVDSRCRHRSAFRGRIGNDRLPAVGRRDLA